jgi:16S rRNA (cytosine967-C5)-methyltransferase
VGASPSPFGRATRAAATQVLEAHVALHKGTPLRAAISNALRKADKLGGQERRFVACAVRELSRHARRIEALQRQAGWPSKKLHLVEDQALLRYALWRRFDTGATTAEIFKEVALPGPIRPRSVPDSVLRTILESPLSLELPDDPIERAAAQHSFPQWLAEALDKVAPQGELDALLAALNREPQLTFCVRPPLTPLLMVEKLAGEGIACKTSELCSHALLLNEDRRQIFETRWVKQGQLFPMDLGSQLIVDEAQLEAGLHVVDYCAGAGGKAIAMAFRVGHTGWVHAYDSSAKRLLEAKRRCAEMKLVNVSFPKEPRIDAADVVLVDAPCSGVGALSREPDQKWKLTAAKVAEFQKTQIDIVNNVQKKMKIGALLVYATCSLLAEENEQVIEAVSKDALRVESQRRIWPHRAQSGGFFAARLRKVR